SLPLHRPLFQESSAPPVSHVPLNPRTRSYLFPLGSGSAKLALSAQMPLSTTPMTRPSPAPSPCLPPVGPPSWSQRPPRASRPSKDGSPRVRRDPFSSSVTATTSGRDRISAASEAVILAAKPPNE